jgi:hypothetical protein
LYNILVDFGITTHLVEPTKMCLNETYGGERVGNHLSEMFAINNCFKKGDNLWPLLFKVAF